MSETLQRIEYRRAVAWAEQVRRWLQPACDRIEIAGSIRRRQRYAGDIELLAIPSREAGMFPGQPGASILDPLIRDLVAAGKLIRGAKAGPKFQQYHLPGLDGCPLKLDLWLVTPATWGVQMLIRTGPADFARRCVTQQTAPHGGGFLRDDCRIANGRVWKLLGVGEADAASHADADVAELEAGHWYQAQATPEEPHVFEFLSIDYLAPERR